MQGIFDGNFSMNFFCFKISELIQSKIFIGFLSENFLKKKIILKSSTIIDLIKVS